MISQRARRLVIALALGFLPFAAGCASQIPLDSDVARAGALWTGPPLPLRVGLLDFSGARGEGGQLVDELARRSFLAVLKASKLVSTVEDGRPAHLPLPKSPALRSHLDIYLRGEVEDWTLYTHYLWWLLWGFFLLPLPGTGLITLVALLLGAPVATDVGALTLRVTAIEVKTGRVLGTYRGRFEDTQDHTIWHRVDVGESFMSHPEIVFQGACNRVVQEMARDRFWLDRFRRP
ncbi:MAG TPA: hypothetical protein VHF22_02360 [Planctomycetota bacterium]|nr:hypothetical protein [Planctomycetota bacterium]